MADTRIKAGQFFGVIGHGTDGYFLMTNADGSMSWSQASTGPSVTSVAYPGDDTAADPNPATPQSVVLTGTGFATSGMTVTIGGTAATAVAHDSSTQLTVTIPSKPAGDYDIVVTNGFTGASGTFVNGISYNGVPTWTTAAGSLGTFDSETTISTITLAATEPDGGTITFNITNGALPTGLSLTGANIDGTTTAESSTTLYSFTIEAIDDENQATPRNFSITVNSAAIVPSQNFTINTYTGNGSTQSIEGKIGTAASFNGSSYISTQGSISGGQSFSISLWCYLNTSSAQESLFTMGSATNNGFFIYRSGQQFAIDSFGFSRYTNTNFFTENTWQHLTITHSSGTNNIYLDGSFVDTFSYTWNINASATTYLGAQIASFSRYLNGKLDQIRIFDKALSSSEVTTLYNEPNNLITASTTDIFGDGSGVALYEFEEGAKDTGGVSGYIGSGAFNFAYNKYITFPSIPNVISSSGNYDSSISIWINLSSLPTGGQFHTLIGRNTTNGSITSELRVLIRDNGSNSIVFELAKTFSGTFWWDQTRSNSFTPNLNQWYNLVISYTASSKSVSYYIDGSSYGTGTLANGGSYTAAPGFNIGTYILDSSSNSTYAYFGKVDQFRIFNKPLSLSEAGVLAAETSASATKSTTDIFDDGSGVALYELEGNANDTAGSYNGTATNVSWGYDGTPTNVSFVGTSFQPDLVWIKPRNANYGNIIYDSVRGTNKRLFTYTTIAEVDDSPYALDSFDTNGFTVKDTSGGDYGINGASGGLYAGNPADYVAWCWKAGGATVSGSGTNVSSVTQSENADAGFGIYRFTAINTNDVNITINHNLNAAPELVISKETSGNGNWYTYHSALGTNKYVLLNSTNAETTAASAWGAGMTSSVIGARTAQTVDSGETHVFYAFHSVDGYQKVGSYSGSNSNLQITTGFQPRLLLLKNTNAAGTPWIMIDSLRTGYLEANSSAAETDTISNYVSFNSTGFLLVGGTGSYINGSGYNWIYLAIA